MKSRSLFCLNILIFYTKISKVGFIYEFVHKRAKTKQLIFSETYFILKQFKNILIKHYSF